MNEIDLQDSMRNFFESVIDARDEEDEGRFAALDAEAIEGMPVESVRTYAEAQVLTSDMGLVLRMLDGSEFQITIVRSR